MTPCPKPVRERKPRKAKVIPRRKQLEQQLEAIVKLIVFWRDGCQCVEHEIDGGRCGGKLNWGHFIPRSRSKYLKYDLATFVQCDSHNLIHDSRKTGGGDPIFGLSFVQTFGVAALEALSKAQREHIDGKVQTILELEELLTHYDDLYQCQYFVNTDIPSRIAAGYYGEIIKNAWIKEGRI